MLLLSFDQIIWLSSLNRCLSTLGPRLEVSKHFFYLWKHFRQVDVHNPPRPLATSRWKCQIWSDLGGLAGLDMVSTCIRDRLGIPFAVVLTKKSWCPFNTATPICLKKFSCWLLNCIFTFFIHFVLMSEFTTRRSVMESSCTPTLASLTHSHFEYSVIC